ncbi:Uncharacterised protein [Mycobacteroides abscessus subsp. abscessus]|nr:Uncharacterised protein [Mycobacteroides abscessus subsp. abscessus]
MKSALEHDDVGVRGCHAGQAHRCLGGLRPGVRIEDGIESEWEDCAELLGEFEQRLMHHRRVLRVDDLGALLLSCGDDPRVAVAGAGDPDAGGEIEVAVSVGSVNPRAERVIDDDGRRLLEDRRQRRGLRRCGEGHGYTVYSDRRIVNN